MLFKSLIGKKKSATSSSKMDVKRVDMPISGRPLTAEDRRFLNEIARDPSRARKLSNVSDVPLMIRVERPVLAR